MMVLLWIGSIIITSVIAEKKKLNVGGYIVFSIFLGPIAVLFVLLASSRRAEPIENEEVFTLEDAKQNLFDIKKSIESLMKKADSLEKEIRKLSGEESKNASKSKKSLASKKIIKPAVNIRKIEQDKDKSLDFESKFGRYWLNKIGIIVLTLGVGYLISYSVQYFGLMNAYVRILFGYSFCGVLFFFGSKLEKNKQYRNLGYALLAGAWALTYFTTFAMHHFEVSKIITNQYIDLFLLMIVVLGMLKHALKYRSESMTALSLLIAYMTSTLSDVSQFTFLSTLIISLIVLVLVYKFQWIKTLILGIIASYFIHFIWVQQHIQAHQHSYEHNITSLLFLSVYLIVFGVGIHLFRLKRRVKIIKF